jgi:hypothetical protein
MESIIIFSLVIIFSSLGVALFSLQKGIKSQNLRLSTRKHVLYPVKNEHHKEALISLYKAWEMRAFCNTISDIQTFKKKGLISKKESKIKTGNLVSKLAV